MNIAKLSMLAATVTLLALPAFAADESKADTANKPAAKASAPAHKSVKKSHKTPKATKKEEKSAK